MKRVSELTGAELDFWVARALGAKDAKIEDWGGLHKVCVTGLNAFEPVPFLPSTKWADGGPIIQNHYNMIEYELTQWFSPRWNAHDGIVAPALLVWMMRAFVASVYGEEVDDSQTHHI